MAAIGISLAGLKIPPVTSGPTTPTVTAPLAPQVYSMVTSAGTMKSSDYSKLTLYEQILLRPAMYVGSISKSTRSMMDRVLTVTNNGPWFQEMNTDYPLGCERLYLEILYNATDNVFNSREKNHEIGEITISMDNRRIRIRNGGVPIPIQIHDVHKIWTPTLIFQELLTSSTYQKKKRTGIGQNGYGAKLTNIFSGFFSVEVGDPYNKRKFYQVWQNNRSSWSEPIITEGYSSEPYVEISFEMDFTRFGYDAYPTEIIGLYAAYATETAFACKVPVTFNGYRFDFKNIYEFSKLLVAPPSTPEGAPKGKLNYIIHYEYPPGTEVIPKRNENGTTSLISKDPNILPITEVCIIDTPHDAKIASYVNAANTKLGGVHVEAVYDGVGDVVLESINSQLLKGTKTLNGKRLNLTKADLKRHMTVIVSCWLDDPDCGPQEKVKLAGPKPKIKFTEKELKPIMDWQMVEQLKIDLDAKTGKSIERKGKRGKRMITGTIQDAYYAGGPKSRDCILYRTEGKSALGYAYTMKSEFTDEQMQFVGISCEKGKPMNVMNKRKLQILMSKKYEELCTHLGLTDGMDYLIEENFNTLRYGTLAITPDADVDGKHITSLLLNVFYCQHPTLLRRPFLCLVRTPIIRVWKGKEVRKFYSIPEYRAWCKITPDYEKWEHKYYKGLATSNNDEVADDARKPKVAYFLYDDETPTSMHLAFDKDLADKRKEWIANNILYDGIEELEKLPISMFIKFEAVQYGKTNLERSIPKFDGLKEVQRKAIYASKQKWKSHAGSDSVKTVKVNQLGSHVSEHTNYHYGEPSLLQTIERMALDYPGTNNLPYFFKDGQFGTRNDSGDDAGDARYIRTRPTWQWPHIFNSEDDDILQRVYDEGEFWEAKIMLPTTPPFYNGLLGVGSGHATFIPNFNYLDLNESVRCILSGNPMPELIPYYNGFTGTVSLEYKTKKIYPKMIDLSGLLLDTKKLYDINLSTILNDIPGEHDENEGPEDTEITLDKLETTEDGDIVTSEGIIIGSESPSDKPLKVVTRGVMHY